MALCFYLQSMSEGDVYRAMKQPSSLNLRNTSISTRGLSPAKSWLPCPGLAMACPRLRTTCGMR